MRNAQITIKMELFGEQAWDGKHETIGVYADADTPHEALSAALYQLLGAFQQQGHKIAQLRLPASQKRAFGRRTDRGTATGSPEAASI